MADGESGKARRRFTVGDLFTDSRPQAAGVTDLANAKEIRVDRILPDPNQPRRDFDPAKLEELAESIRREGLLQPIAVRYDEDVDRYVILHGERRWRAHVHLGLPAIAAMVRDVPPERRLIQQLMENIVRDDLNPVDRAAALRALKVALGDVPWETVADAVGIRRSRLFQLIGTEKLPPVAQDDLRAGRMNEKQSRALHGLPEDQQEALREAIVAGDVAAEEAMRLARDLRARSTRGLEEARRALDDARRPASRAPQSTNAASLLALIESSATGDAHSAGALRRELDRHGAAAYDPGRLEQELLTLAMTLGRMTQSERDRARAPLGALRDTLSAMLD